MLKKYAVIVVAVVALMAFGSSALAQENTVRLGDEPAVGTDATVVKVAQFETPSDTNSYLVIAQGLTVDAGDCCIAGDAWRLQAFGLLGFGSSTTGTASIGGTCTPPTSGYTGAIRLPAWFIGLVMVRPVPPTPGGFPAGMYVRFTSQGSVRVQQLAGTDPCAG